MTRRDKIETAADAATIVVAALLSAVLVKTYLLPASGQAGFRTGPPAAAREIDVGTNLQERISGVNWRKNGRTLVLAISTRCHFCKDSTAFYRKVQERAEPGLKVLAVLPQPLSEAEQFLATERLHPDQVKQATLGEIGVQGTPTMLLVNKAGIVIKKWVGRVRPEEEQEIISALRKG
jgi:hypothetical protein